MSQGQTIVDRYGQLRVSGNRIVDKNGTATQLRGMSLYWSQWIPKYYNYNTIKWLRDDWKITVIRAAMAVDNGGYATNPAAEQAKVLPSSMPPLTSVSTSSSIFTFTKRRITSRRRKHSSGR